MTRNVYSVGLFVYNLCAELHKLVNDVADGLFVARYRRCRNYNIVVRAYVDVSVIRKRHPRQCGHRLALTARGYNDHILGRVLIYHINTYYLTLFNIEVAHLCTDGYYIFKASARERNFSAHLFGNVYNLLNAVHV